MFLSLLKKECAQTAKSLIYWLFVLCLSLFFFSQMGAMDFENPPVKNQQGGYGMKESYKKQDIMAGTLGTLTQEYYRDTFITFPIGFNKEVKVDKKEKQQIKKVLETTTGMSEKDIFRSYEKFLKENTVTASNGTTIMPQSAFRIEPKEGLTYSEFQKEMEKICKVLGPGSSYEKKRLKTNGMVKRTYEDAMEEYQNLNEKDKITGGYARLFCDYMGIILGILPVFVVVTRELRDKRAKMKELVFVRKASSFTIIMSRYVSMCLMMFLPVLLISFYPLAECVGFAQGKGVNVQYTAFIIYSFGWLLPSILAVTGLGMFLTELTETAAAILVQGAWWFVSIFSGTAFMGGGNYGMNLIPRHNTQFNYLGFKEDFSSLVLNRSFYAALGIALVIAAVMVFEAKRKGKLKYGKMSGNRKGKHKASFADSVSC
nr:ABC transporter permease [uncultured Sellimonas sp.]